MLDNRAATYTKLGRLKTALRDGKRMIDQNECDCKGYLRAGKILQLLENSNAALAIYQLGLRKVPANDPNKTLLKGLSNRLVKQCAPAKAIDPFRVLPIEIVDMILSYVSFSAIVRLLRVSRSWSNLLRSMPRLWANLDFSGSIEKDVSYATLRQYVKSAQGTCSAISIPRLANVNHNLLDYVASRCRGLSEIRVFSKFASATLLKAVPNAANLQVLVVSWQCHIPADTVSQLLDLCGNLKRAEFHTIINASNLDIPKHNMEKMHTLVMNAVRSRPAALSCSDLLSRIGNIRSLTLRDWTNFDFGYRPVDFSHSIFLEYLDISHVTMVAPPKLPVSLRSLDMSYCNHSNQRGAQPYEPSDLPNLSTLLLRDSFIYSTPQIIDLITTSKCRLQNVDLSIPYHNGLDPTSLILNGYLSDVENLKLRACHAVGDEVASLLATKLLKIQQLDLSRTRITGVGVKALLTGLAGKLTWLELDECSSTSIDAVELARSMGVRVSYNFPDVRGSRQIRPQPWW